MIEDVSPEVRAALVPVRECALEDAARWLASGVDRAQLVTVAIDLCRVLDVGNLIASEYVDAMAEFVERLTGNGEA